MLTRPHRRVTTLSVLGTVIAAAALGALAATPAHAEGGCKDGRLVCVGVDTPGSPGTTTPSGDTSGSGPAPGCTWGAMTVQCSLPGKGFFYQGCYYTAAAAPAPDDPVWQTSGKSPGDTSGGFYNPTYCLPGEEGVQGNLRWLPIPAAATMTPEELARRALSKLRLLPPPMHLTPGPGKTGLVSLPVWLWVDANANTWGPASDTDADGPLSLTLTAAVERIVWDMGDGDTVTCTTPGVPYDPAYGDRMSPECGYAYQHISKGQPNDAFTVTATTHWKVTWTASTGATGTIPGVTRTSTVGDIRVGELQVVNT
ncbi:hypothetical protein GCM10023205_76980 [Yinghuangia aomiensis]|uniref:PKD domain-containing protein n=1 Tax=Yinghuangia aomiensis TaxID=676205 RepID=A0ABP9IB33_9ACTN